MQYQATSKTLVKAMSSSIQCFGRNRSKSLLAIGSSKDPVIKIYNEDDNYTSPQVVKVDGGNSSVTFSNDTKRLITGGWSYKLGAWDIGTGKKDTTFIAHASKITALAMTSDDVLISADHGGLIKLWRYPGFEFLGQLKGHTAEVTSLQLVESDKTLVSSSLDGSVKVWDIAKQTNVKSLPCPGARVNDIAWDPFNKVLYSAEESGKIIKWQGGTWKKLKEYPTQTEMYDIDLNVDGEYLIAGGQQYQLSILETRTMKPVEAFTESRHGNYRVNFLDNGSVVAGNFAGELIKANIDLPVPYADVLYNAISTDPFYNDALYAYRGDYTAALLQASQKVMEPFVYGKDILPGPDDVKRGILQTEKALSLNKDEPGSVTIITCKLLFLKGLKILAENDVSRLDSAAGYFKKIIEMNPYATYPHNALSLVHSKKKEVDKAKASLAKASQMIPAWTEPKNNLGKNLIVEGNLKEADKAFRQIVQLEPDASKGYRGLAELALVEGDLKKAESLFREASGKTPSVYYSCQLAHIDFLKGKFNDAFSQLENAIKADASYYLSHLYISNFYLNLFETHFDDPEYVVRAFDEATEALRLNPFSADCYFALAQVYNRLGILKEEKYDKTEAVVFRTKTGTHDYEEKKREYIKKGIELSLYDGKGYYWSALLLNKTSRADAFKVFKDKIKDKYEYFLYLGKIYLEEENYVEAEKAFVQAARIKKDLYEPTLGLITVHRRSRNYVALSNVEKSLMPRDKENPLIAQEIALAYTESADRKKEGIAGAEGLLKAYPDFKKATFLLKSAHGRSRTTENVRDEIQLPFSTIKPFPDGLNMVTIGNKTCLTDNAGVVVLRTSFVPVFVTSARAMVVQSADKFGVVSFKGDTIAAFDYDEIKEEKGYLVTRTGKYYGLLNQSGKKVINSQYQALKLFDDFVAFQHGGNWGAISYRGSTIMNPRYSSISPKTYKGKSAIQGTLRNGSHYYSVDGQCLKCN
jgi:tetratricopeptide (TPR) repeat protein